MNTLHPITYCYRHDFSDPCPICERQTVPVPVVDAPAQKIDATLAARGATYGLFEYQAQITQQLKETMHDAQKWSLLPDDMKESLDMIASKIARILNGDPQYADSWYDIAGYALLIEKRLTPKEQK